MGDVLVRAQPYAAHCMQAGAGRLLCAPPHLQSRSSRESESMGAQENGLTLEGLAHKLETMQRENAERMEALERENERMRSKNTELRDEVAALRDSGTRRGGLSETSSLV